MKHGLIYKEWYRKMLNGLIVQCVQMDELKEGQELREVKKVALGEGLAVDYTVNNTDKRYQVVIREVL